MTIDCWVIEAAAHTPTKVALRFKQLSISYAELSHMIDDAVDTLTLKGVKLGDRVAWYGLNHPDVFVLLFACARLGAVLVPLNWRLAEPEVAAIVANCAPTLLFYDEHFAQQALALPNVSAVAASALLAKLPDASLDSTGKPTSNTEELLTTEVSTQVSAIGPSVDSPILLVYTSGSTGWPKGAVLTQKSLISNARMSVHAHAMTADDIALVMLPLFHVGGLNILPTPAFSIGATVLLHERFDPDLACIDLPKATLAITVPTILQALVGSRQWSSVSLESMKGMSIGSTDVPLSLINQIHALNVPLIQVYGATETGPFAIYQTISEAMSTVGSIGRAGCDCQIRLVMEGQDVEVGEPGEIWVKGDNVLLEYWQDPELTQSMLVDGWLRTGDVAMQDECGLYWFKDRIKHVIISGGENIYPTEIERVLQQVPGIREVCVVGVSDEKWGEIPVAVVATNSPMSNTDVLSALNGQLARYKHPKSVVFVDTLPRNAMGKVVAANVKAQIRGQFTL